MLSEKLLHNQHCNIHESKSFLSLLQDMDFMALPPRQAVECEGLQALAAETELHTLLRTALLHAELEVNRHQVLIFTWY